MAQKEGEQERVFKKLSGKVTSCEEARTANTNKLYFKVWFDNNSNYFSYWKDDGFDIGDEVEFEYDTSEVNGRTYFNIKNIISLKSINPSKYEKKRIQEITNVPMDNIQKMIFDNDNLNRKAMMIKCAFDYGNRKNMEYAEILNIAVQLQELLK